MSNVSATIDQGELQGGLNDSRIRGMHGLHLTGCVLRFDFRLLYERKLGIFSKIKEGENYNLNLRARAKITSHFRIPSSGHLRLRLNRR